MTTVSYTVTTRYEGQSRRGEPLPAGRIVLIEAEVILPVDATRAEVLEWIAFELGWGSLALTNPLSDRDLDLAREPTLTDSGYTTDRLQRREEATQEARAHYAQHGGGERETQAPGDAR